MSMPSRPSRPSQVVLDFPRLTALVATVVLHLLALMFLTHASRPRLSASPSVDTVTRLIWVVPSSSPSPPQVDVAISPLAASPEPAPALPIVDAAPTQERAEVSKVEEDADVASQSAAPPEFPEGVEPLAHPPLPYSGTEALLPIMVWIIIDPEGEITSVSIAQSSGSEQWDAVAMEHVREQWKFQGYGVSRLATFPLEVSSAGKETTGDGV